MTDPKTIIRVATITVSTRCAAGSQEDVSGKLLHELLAIPGIQHIEHLVLPDDESALVEALRNFASQADVVLTTGGTGISPRDVTPEATAQVVTRRLPGVETVLHLAGSEKVPTSILSRAVVGVCGQCLIINLPGSPGGVRDGMAVVTPILSHAVRLIRGEVRDCQRELAAGAEDSTSST